LVPRCGGAARCAHALAAFADFQDLLIGMQRQLFVLRRRRIEIGSSMFWILPSSDVSVWMMT
jgi:hypothetical protein